MDWIKVKTKHIFHDGFNKTTLWAWIRIMGLVAEIEAIPNDRQILTIITKHELELLSNHFKGEGKLLSNILQSVLEDVQSVKIKRELGKERQRKYREKIELSRVTLPLHDEADKIREDKIRLDKRERCAFAPPTLEEVIAYCQERNNGIQAETFIDYYTSLGWVMKNGKKMKDWKAAIRNWENRRKEDQKKGAVKNGYCAGVSREEYERLAEGRE